MSSSSRSKALSAERFQYRVGHGGFHATLVQTPARRLTYVYDVGAHPSKSLLLNAIAAFVAELTKSSVKTVDFVIISHIDEDHVNGIVNLLDALNHASIRCDTVILPWLSPVEKLLAQSRNSHRQSNTAVSRLSGSDLEADAYLRGHGAENIIRITEGGEGPINDTSGPSLQRDPGIVGSGIRLATPLIPSWKLVPIKLSPDPAAINTFRNYLRQHSPFDPDDLSTHQELLGKHRTVVRDAMKAGARHVPGVIAKEITNWSSLALYSGATKTSPSCSISAKSVNIQISCTHGWLHTGDLPLASDVVWLDFKKQMKAASLVLPVCVLVAPHHGSHLSHRQELYSTVVPGNVALTTGRYRSGRHAKGINPHNATTAAASVGATLIDLNN